MGKPHMTKEITVEKSYQCIIDEYDVGNITEERVKLLSKDFFEKLCQGVWGRELTYLEVDEVIAKLMRARIIIVVLTL